MPPDMLRALRRTLRRAKRWTAANPKPQSDRSPRSIFKRPKRLDGHKPIAPLRVVPTSTPRRVA